jgi:hypothetical protein
MEGNLPKDNHLKTPTRSMNTASPHSLPLATPSDQEEETGMRLLGSKPQEPTCEGAKP